MAATATNVIRVRARTTNDINGTPQAQKGFLLVPSSLAAAAADDALSAPCTACLASRRI
jgi:hypothetical protein